MRYVSLAFTGYRTEKLPFPPDEKNLSALRDRLAEIISGQTALGVRYYMTGMCRGSDLIAADAVLSLRDKLGIELWCAVPFRGHRQTIPKNELGLYDAVLEKANGVVVVRKDTPDASEYGRCYNERNRFMVDHCDGLIAICPERDITPGGTKNTVEMARRAGKKVIFVL